MTTKEHEKSDDWREGRSLVDSCSYMLKQRIATDVTFRVGSSRKEIKAHKFMLICRSAVFQAMLNGEYADGFKDIEVTDVEPSTFHYMLSFMYSGDVDVNGDNVLSLLYTSKKYALHDLVQQCMAYLTDDLDVDNVCSILEQAHFYNESGFQDKSRAFILTHGADVLETSGFQELCYDCVKGIIASDDLHCPEVNVLESVTKWAEKQCTSQGKTSTPENIRSSLGDILFLIRFPLIDKSYFTNVLADSDLLTDSEKVELFKYFYKSNGETTSFVCRKRNQNTQAFDQRVSKKTHACYTGTSDGPTILTCLRFSSVCEDGSWYCGGETDAVAFEVDHSILLHGVLVYGSYIGEGKYEVKTVVMDDNDTELMKCNTTIKTTEEQLTYVVLFDNVITVNQNRKYTVCVKLLNSEGVDTYQGLNGNAVVTVHNFRFSFSKTKQSRNGTDVKIGQIPGLLFSGE